MAAKLASVLAAISWDANVEWFCQKSEYLNGMNAALARLAVWAKQLEQIDQGNPAITFVREAQVESYHAVQLVSLGLYKPAAAAMRAMVECSLYYTYFRSHGVELQTLVRDSDYYLDKGGVVQFHREHTVGFRAKEQALGVLQRLDAWYSRVSGIVHGQIPGKWVTSKGLADVTPNEGIAMQAVAEFVEAERIVHEVLLVTIEPDSWHSFPVDVRRVLLKAVSADAVRALDLK